MEPDALYLHRCLELARLGLGTTAPNPLVGAVLVHKGRVIGEGFHQVYGQAHAEVNCLRSVSEADRILIPDSCLYVSLEPCAHQGKTPPCTALIIEHKIPRVVIGCADPFEKVNGRGIDQLRQAGVEVIESSLSPLARKLNSRFFTFHQQKRPYIILKWARSADGKMAGKQGKPVSISNSFSKRLVHHWRSEEAGILIGTNTAILDDPLLTNRYWPGPSPLRLIIDRNGRIPETAKIFKEHPTMVFTCQQKSGKGAVKYYQLNPTVNLIQALMNALHELNILSVLVEGGATLLQSLIQANCWDEARIITNESLLLQEGVDSPSFPTLKPAESLKLDTDRVDYFFNPNAVTHT